VVKNYTIVVIEDNQYVSETLQKSLEGKYSRLEYFDDCENALNNLHKIVPDIMIIDMFCGQ